jgi:hypothetical protein
VTYRAYRQYHIHQSSQSDIIGAVIRPGFSNPMDACYVNSFMQLLFRIPPLRLLIVAWSNRDLTISALYLMFIAISQDRFIDVGSLSSVCEPTVFDGKDCFELVSTVTRFFAPFLLQTCFRSTFILLTPPRFRILYLDQMPEFLPQGHLTWSWTTSNATKFHSFISQVLLLKSCLSHMDKRSSGERL